MNQIINQGNNTIELVKKIAVKVIMDCKKILAHKFRTRFGFKKYIILTKEQSVLIRIISSIEEENMQAR